MNIFATFPDIAYITSDKTQHTASLSHDQTNTAYKQGGKNFY